MAKIKKGDFVRLNNGEIQRHIDLLRVYGFHVWEDQDRMFSTNDNAIILDYTNSAFSIIVEDFLADKTEITKHDWVCAVIGLEVGMGMRSDMSTHEQRMHITVELGKLGIVSLIDPTERDYSYSFKINNTYKWVANMSVDNNIPYSEWCKKLGIEPIHEDHVNCEHESQKWCKDCYEQKHDRILGISNTENIITLADGTKVDLTKPLEFRNNESENWFSSNANWLERHYIGVNRFNKKLVFFDENDDCFISVFIRNTPKPKFKEGDPIFINEFGKWVYCKMKYNVTYSGEIIPAINPDGTPNFPPFND